MKKKLIRELPLFPSSEGKRIEMSRREVIPEDTLVILQMEHLEDRPRYWKISGVKRDTKSGQWLTVTIKSDREDRPSESKVKKVFKVKEIVYGRRVRWKTGFGLSVASYIYDNRVVLGPDIPFA